MQAPTIAQVLGELTESGKRINTALASFMEASNQKSASMEEGLQAMSAKFTEMFALLSNVDKRLTTITTSMEEMRAFVQPRDQTMIISSAILDNTVKPLRKSLLTTSIPCLRSAFQRSCSPTPSKSLHR